MVRHLTGARGDGMIGDVVIDGATSVQHEIGEAGQ